jgi:hypothetical protein
MRSALGVQRASSKGYRGLLGAPNILLTLSATLKVATTRPSPEED